MRKGQELEERKAIRRTCEELYIEMDKGVEELTRLTGISDKTIYRWIKDGEWESKKTESRALEKKIEKNLKRALNKGLESFAENTENKDLQSLVSLLKQFKETHKPTAAYKDNIIKFLDRTKDFFLEKNMPESVEIFNSVLVELAEYLLKG